MTVTETRTGWDLKTLRTHLQGLVDLEMWTIPYYMAAMYSITEPAHHAFRLIEAVIREEMLHLQLACNIANAYGQVPTFKPPVYQGKHIPHIDFSLNDPDPTQYYKPYSAEIGPLDEKRVNTMCLVEYPKWGMELPAATMRTERRDYGSIAEFYDAVSYGMCELVTELRSKVNQVDEFGYFYNRFPKQRITKDGPGGLAQALGFVDLIVDQGEGESKGDSAVAVEHRNTADGYKESWSHFRRFNDIRSNLSGLPPIYQASAEPGDEHAREARRILIKDFRRLLDILGDLFAGRPRDDFGACMAEVGGDILACWQHGVVPKFS
ncbi:ferritin-like domain-containing protein [Actinomadura sp. 9N215]|uniref:ferritin-like domain-containing protein n=1 Tax=Actinomadura sp. 9N215 TaxID=3375150 RepID=UPI00378F7FA7